MDVRAEFREHQKTICVPEADWHNNYIMCEIRLDESENRTCYYTLYDSSFQIDCKVYDDAKEIWDGIEKMKPEQQE